LEALESTLFGSEGRQQRTKKPKSRGQADEEECVKRIDKVKKTTVVKPDLKKGKVEEVSKIQKKTSAAKGRGKTNSQ
jgi:hypothetical protein